MAREAHLEAAKHHLVAASKHLAAVDRYNDDDPGGAVSHSDEARMASRFADGKSTEAHRLTTIAANVRVI
jgi:hypothetical protein